MKIDDLKKSHASKPRNELIADVFFKAGLIETWGRGTVKIIEECKKAGLPEPEFK
jgi:ATP-dependent DNA helicase RecG